ncbi:Pectate lyase superfamily protein [compost metagenome]
MNRYPWRHNTSEDIANQRPSQWETPAGAQAKADQAEKNAKDYTDAHSEAGAEVNQNAYSVVNGIHATSKMDSIEIEAGTGILVTPVPTEKKIRITAGGTAIPGLHGAEHVGHGADPIPEATTTDSGLMSAADKNELVTSSGTFPKLPDRLNAFDAQLADIAINILSIGAVGDGVTDDIDAINNAILVAESRGGGTVLVPPGKTFIISNQINMKSNIRFIIEGTIKLGDDANWHVLMLNGCSNVIIEGNGTIDGNKSAQSGSSYLGGIYTMNNASHIVIRDIKITNCLNWAVNILNSHHVLLDNIETSYSTNSTQFAGECYACFARNIESHHLDDYGFAFYGVVRDCGIINSYIHHNGIDGISCFNDAGQEASKDITIIGNIVSHNDYSGISVRTDLDNTSLHSGIVISGNTIHHNNQANIQGAGGIWLQSGESISVTDNVIHDDGNGESSTVGINVAPQDYIVRFVNIRGNTIRNEGIGGGLGVGIQLYPKGSDILIEGNTLLDDQPIKTTAFQINGIAGDNVVIKNNNIQPSVGPRVRLTLKADSIVQGNKGYNPVGILTAPVIGEFGGKTINTFGFPVRIFVKGTGIIDILINDVSTLQSGGMFWLEPGESITLSLNATNSVSWVWYGM